jgi:glycosyltransferase involved in cell wall biosynthesis
MNVKPITVSALIPTLNRRNYVRRAIDSILAQTVPVDEIIVVDDEYSRDNIAEAIAGWYGSKVRVILGQNGGLSGARRRALEEASGDWIAFLDSDDDWPVKRNEEFLAAAASVSSDVAWLFGDTQIITDAGKGATFFQEFGLHIAQSPHVFPNSLAVQYPFQFGVLSSSFIRRTALLECGCFQEKLQHSEDVLAGFQVACRYRFGAVPSVVGSYYRTSDLMANSALLKGMWGPDYFRSRMLAFAAVITAGQKTPWNYRYATEVRDFCKALAKKGQFRRRLAFEQFRYGAYSIKGLLFLAAAMFGCLGVEAWDAVGGFRRSKIGSVRPGLKSNASGLQAYVQSVFGKN